MNGIPGRELYEPESVAKRRGSQLKKRQNTSLEAVNWGAPAQGI